MAEISKIQWTGATWNPFVGCEKVSAGCKFCYAERFIEGRFQQDFRTVKRTKDPTFYLPIKLSKKFTGDEPFNERLVFTCSLSDFFIKQGDGVRWQLWQMIRETPNLIYQILTKRPERILQNLPDDWGAGYQNVWLGTSTEDQKTFDERVQILAQVPARVRFLSIEPILGPIDVEGSISKIDWVIIGGESGGKNQFRPASLSWLEQIVSSCRSADVPVFVKQLGTHLAKEIGSKDFHGGQIDEFPESILVRQWPKIYSDEEKK